jgi:alpha-L-rhamnosidase
MLNYLAGIQRHPDEPGFQRLLLQPYIPSDLAWVEAEKKTAYGTVKSAWKQEDGKVAWSFTVPPNSVAEVCLPDGLKNLRAQGQEVAGSKNRLELAAGSYQLEWSR